MHYFLGKCIPPEGECIPRGAASTATASVAVRFGYEESWRPPPAAERQPVRTRKCPSRLVVEVLSSVEATVEEK